MLPIDDWRSSVTGQPPAKIHLPVPPSLKSMRIPASRLLASLEQGVSLPLRTHDFKGAHPGLDYTEIMSLVMKGEVEGIAAPSGRVKLLRLLPIEEREKPAVAAPAVDTSKSTAFAQTNMGVYREAVYSMEDHGGIQTKVVISHVFAHCAHRNGFSARAAQ